MTIEEKTEPHLPHKRVSAVVVSYFTGPVLARCLASLNAQPEITEIVLVDNGNSEGAIDAAIKEAGAERKTTILSGHGNIGFSAACNKGADAANNNLILLFNPDAVMPDNSIRKMLDAAQDLRGAWLMGARLIGQDGMEQQGSRRGALTPRSAILEASQLYRVLPKGDQIRFNLHQTPPPSEMADIPTLSGACMLTPRADYFAIGGMDEGYFLHVEDVDLCRRFVMADGRVLFYPHVSITHFKGSSRANSIRVERFKTQSMSRYFRKHFSDVYPAPVLWMLTVLLWIFFGVRLTLSFFKEKIRMVQFLMRRGFRGLKRAQTIHAHRLSR